MNTIKLNLPQRTAIVSLLLAAAAGAQDLFSVSFFGYGRQNSGDVWTQQDVRASVQMDGVKQGGIWNTTAWQNRGPAGFPGTWTITAADGTSTATLSVTNLRASSAYGCGNGVSVQILTNSFYSVRS